MTGLEFENPSIRHADGFLENEDSFRLFQQVSERDREVTIAAAVWSLIGLLFFDPFSDPDSGSEQPFP